MSKFLWKQLSITGVPGILGGLLRYTTYLGINQLFSHQSWIATICVNVIGTFLLSLLIEIEVNHFGDYKSEVLSGLIGSFTTFSTLIADTHSLTQQFSLIFSILYIGLSISLGLLMVPLGTHSASIFNTKYGTKINMDVEADL